MTARQKIFLRKKCRFCNFNWLPWQRPLMDRQNQKNAGFIKILHSSTKAEILVKIRSVVPEIDLLQS